MNKKNSNLFIWQNPNDVNKNLIKINPRSCLSSGSRVCELNSESGYGLTGSHVIPVDLTLFL